MKCSHLSICYSAPNTNTSQFNSIWSSFCGYCVAKKKNNRKTNWKIGNGNQISWFYLPLDGVCLCVWFDLHKIQKDLFCCRSFFQLSSSSPSFSEILFRYTEPSLMTFTFIYNYCIGNDWWCSYFHLKKKI